MVGTMHTPPFAIHSDDGHWSGFSIELFERIAETLGAKVEWREYDYDLQALLHAVEHRHLDAAIAALPMNATYEETLDFSHPYFRTGLGIAVHRRPPQLLLGIIHGVFSWQFLGGVAILAGLLVGMGTLIWVLERRGNSQHFHPRFAGGAAALPRDHTSPNTNLNTVRYAKPSIPATRTPVPVDTGSMELMTNHAVPGRVLIAWVS